MNTASRPLVLAALLLTGCQRDSTEAIGSGSSAIVSPELTIACEPGNTPALAVANGLALVAWAAPNGTVHAARIDSNGTVLDATPLALGMPAPSYDGGVQSQAAGGQHVQSRVVVVRDGAGFAVLASFREVALSDAWSSIQSRTVDAAGNLGPWQIQYVINAPQTIGANNVGVMSGADDGANAYLAIDSAYEVDVLYYHTYRVRQLNGPELMQVPYVIVSGSPSAYYSPTWGGFGCRTASCLATYQDAQTNASKARILGQAAVANPNFQVGPIVGSPLGFLQVGSSAVAFSTTASVTGGPTGLWTATSGAAHDGTVTRAVFADSTDGHTAGIGDDASIVAAPSLDLPGFGNYARIAIASFGSGRSLVVHADANAVTARFVGSVPAMVPVGCPIATSSSAASTTGAGGSSTGSAGGAGGSSTASSSGGATDSSTSGAGGSSATGIGGAGSPATGTGGTGGSTATGTGSSVSTATGTGGQGTGGASSGDGGGTSMGGGTTSCSCEVPGRAGSGAWTLVLAAFGAWRTRRRRRAQR